MRRAFLTILVVATLAVPVAASSPAVARVAPRVQLITAGAKPRAVLRLAPAAGTTRQTSLTISVNLEQSGVSSARSSARIRGVYTTTIISVAADGTFHVTFRYNSLKLLDSSADPSARKSTQDLFDTLAGFSGEYTMDARGAVLDTHFTVPVTGNALVDQLLKQFKDQAAQLAVPFPTAAVGVGARWRVTTKLDFSGIHAQQTYTYTLRRREGNRAELAVRFTQTAPHSKVHLPGVPDSVTVRITDFAGTGSGTTTSDLTQPFPVRSTLRLTSHQAFHVKRGSDTGSLNQSIQIETTVDQA